MDTPPKNLIASSYIKGALIGLFFISDELTYILL